MSTDTKGDPKFLTINKKDDWEKGYTDNLIFSGKMQGIRIQSGPCYRIRKAVPVKDLIGSAAIIDVVPGCPGILYILCSEGYLWIYDIERNFAEKYDGTEGDTVFSGAERLALKGDVLYITGKTPTDTKVGYITAIDLQTLEILWSSNSYLIPQDLTCDEKGNLYLLDEDSVIIKIDRCGNLIGRLETGYPAAQITQIEAVGEDKVALYDSKSNEIAIADLKQNTIGDTVISIDRAREVKGLYSDCKSNIYTLEFFKINKLAKKTGYLAVYYPQNGTYQSAESFNGSVSFLCMGYCGNACALNSGKTELLILDPVNTIVSKATDLLPQGTYISHPLDSAVYDMKWHRLEMNMEIPEDTQVSVSFMTNNEKLTVNGENYLHLPWSKPVINPADTLIEADTGRYLWIRIDLIGTTQLSPTVKEITAYFPRTSYLRYLPAVYQEDTESRNFLEGFLSMFETLLMGTEGQIDNIAALFDPDCAPPEFLNYIAQWLSLPVSEYWDEERLRELIRKSSDIYKTRGTREGLRSILNIFLQNKAQLKYNFQYNSDTPLADTTKGSLESESNILSAPKVFIVENFQVRNVKDLMDEPVKKELEDIFADDPYSFHIFVNKVENESNGKFSVRDITGKDMSEVKRIIDVEKPAYTKACVTMLEPDMILDGHTYIGINTCLREPKQRLDEGYRIRRDTGVIDIEDMKINFD